MSESSQDPGFDSNLAVILSGVSIFLCFIFVQILKKKQSNYARIVRHISMSEGIYTFFFLGVILRSQKIYFNTIKNFSKKIFHILTFNLFYSPIEIENKDDSIEKLMDVFNLAAYYANEAFSLSLSIFICLELILILRNPIAQMKSRLKPYFIVSSFLGFTVFVMNLTIGPGNLKESIKIEEYLFADNFQL